MTDDTRDASEGEGLAGPTLDQLLDYMGRDGETVEQIRQMCNSHLDRPLARDEELALAEIQDRFEAQQRAYVVSLQSSEISRQRYLDAMNDLLSHSMARYFDVLGKMRFLRIFGEAGYESDKLIDRVTFLGEDQPLPSPLRSGQ